MINVNIIIKRPVEDVWNYFTNVSNWSKWNGGEIIHAEWKKGGSVKWGMGSPSQINNYEFQKLVTIGSTWIDTDYRFSSCNEGTLFTIEEGSPKNASWPDGGLKHTRELKDSLNTLKQKIESSGKIEAVESTVHVPENMSPDDFIKQMILSNLLNSTANESKTGNNIPDNSQNEGKKIKTGQAVVNIIVGALLFVSSIFMFTEKAIGGYAIICTLIGLTFLIIGWYSLYTKRNYADDKALTKKMGQVNLIAFIVACVFIVILLSRMRRFIF
jgi:hypothetical protein